MDERAIEVAARRRFEFGDNWARFIEFLDEPRVSTARMSLQSMLETESLKGKRFVDVGSGSGLFSLAARGLGAMVHSFDYDLKSVACTRELRRRYFPDDPLWRIDQGSVLDQGYLEGLGDYDVVYAWGVLHHTGAMWEAFGNLTRMAREGGKLCVAIYNDQGRTSRVWTRVKRLYNQVPCGLRWLMLLLVLVRMWAPTIVRDTLRGNPLRTWYGHSKDRGMSPWHDLVDWVGGYPFQVAKPEEVFDFCSERGFVLKKLKTCGGGHGCNEFVFEKTR